MSYPAIDNRYRRIALVTLFSTPTCAPCRAAARKFDAEGIEYMKVDLTEDAGALADLKERLKSDIIQTPLFEFDGEIHNITELSNIIARAKV